MATKSGSLTKARHKLLILCFQLAFNRRENSKRTGIKWLKLRLPKSLLTAQWSISKGRMAARRLFKPGRSKVWVIRATRYQERWSLIPT